MAKWAHSGLARPFVGIGSVVLCAWLASACAAVPPPAGVDCSAHPQCGVDGPGCSAGLNCISIPGCGSAICIPPAQACLESCGTPNCELLESYPEQISCSGKPPVPGRPGAALSCDDLEAQRAVELQSIQRCMSDSECGQPLTGTSCGCTRDLVARADADTSRFYDIEAALVEQQCGGLASTCDCPAAEGFRCTNGFCGWNYTN